MVAAGEDGLIQQVGRELDITRRALAETGSGAQGTLECRLADLQHRLLAAPAQSLDDVEAKLRVVRTLVAELGPRGYLLDLVEATLADVQALQRAG
jgi:hypothetical protein